MNLYMSFSNLLEIWVTEGGPPNIISDRQEGLALEDKWEGGDSGHPLTLSGTTSMSKSDVGAEDSGVEITSSEASLPSSSPSVSMCNTAIDPVSTSIREEDGLPSTSPPCSPVLSPPSFCSSSSLSLCLRTRAQGHRELAVVMHRKVEQALRRTDTSGRRQVLRHGGRDAVSRQQCHMASLPSTHSVTHNQRAGHRLGSAGLRRTVSLSVVDEQASTELLQHRGGLSPQHNTLPPQTETEIRENDVCERSYEGLTPGLGYLEHVCRMLEEIARLQMHNQRLQVEMEALREQQESRNSQHSQCDCKAAEDGGRSANERRLNAKDYVEDLACQSFKNNSNVHQHFRQRSASDTRLMMGYLRKAKEESGRQYLSIEDLLEQPKDDKKQEKEEVGNKEQGSRIKTWKLKIGSLRREETTEKTSKPIHSSVEKVSGRRLRQLFKRRKTVPE
ncbi:uncharacterized protein LOC118385656 [Oncorhynchus keta]|uniref:uncharacterized protein LOC118385656 n=1 Tax=Oncorhynchus keta TaxID=8018 RepID=UPI0015FA3C98|nr:uncharacterized protein LOC118385656 [Oncorhynchus keta]